MDEAGDEANEMTFAVAKSLDPGLKKIQKKFVFLLKYIFRMVISDMVWTLKFFVFPQYRFDTRETGSHCARQFHMQ